VPVTRRELAGVAGLLILMAILAWPGLSGNSVTIDEFAHVPAGYLALTDGALDIYPKTPPLIRVLEATPWLLLEPRFPEHISETLDPRDPWHPWILGDAVMRLNARDYDRLFLVSRMVTLGLGLLGGLLAWVWSRRLFGPRGGLLSLALTATSPTILAHSAVSTVDIGTTVLFTGTLFTLQLFLEAPSFKGAFTCGLILAGALLSKMTSLILLPLIIVITVAAAVFSRRKQPERITSLLGGLAVIVTTGLLFLNLAYGFQGTFSPWDSHRFSSRFLDRASSLIPDRSPAGLPSWYLFGLDAQLVDLEVGEFPNYLMGKWSTRGNLLYFPIAFATKEPLPFLILFVGALVALANRRSRRTPLIELILLLPIATVFAVALQGGRLQIGLRYLLPIYLLIFIETGRLGAAVDALSGKTARTAASLALVSLLGAQGVIVALSGPDYLSFFNLAVGGPSNGHRILLDSNLDWGQDLKRAVDWCAEREIQRPFVAYFGHVDPAIYGLDTVPPPMHPVQGVYIVSAAYLHGMPYPETWSRIPADRIDVTWLLERTPSARIGNSMFVYFVE